MHTFRSQLLVLCSLSCMSASLAYGQPGSDLPKEKMIDQAQKLLSEANAHYAAEEYSQAREAYQAAYDLTQAPGFLYNIAQSYRLAGQCRPAIEYYEKFLSLEPKTALRAKVESFVAEMWTCLQKEKAEAEVNRAESERSQDPSGAAQVAVPSDDAGNGTSGGLSASTAERESQESSPLPTIGLVVAGSGVLALGSAVYFGLSARSTSQEVESFEGMWRPEEEAKEEKAQGQERLSLILGLAGGAALAGGLVTYYLFDSRESSRIALLPSTDGVMFSYSSDI
jgi:tetratricopeptide (TPR) repeat protein